MARLPLLVALVAPLVPGPVPDLDVAVPPGSPLDYGRTFPALMPRRGPLFPEARPPGTPPDRTVSRPARSGSAPRITSPFGVLRILTWDLRAHVTWISGLPDRGAVTGNPARATPLPQTTDALYWISLAPLLRLMLHPQAVSGNETLVHLLELGEPVLGVLDAATAEPRLSLPSRWLRVAIAAPREDDPEPLAGLTPRDAMMSRFVLEELQRAHPYDPEADFGRRLFLIGDELEPLVARYTAHDDAFVRRNAVSALGRYTTRKAAERTLMVAATSDDLVAAVRALASLGSARSQTDPSVLVSRLDRARDRVERTALIGALGRQRIVSAAPKLVELGEEALKKDPDLLLTIVPALSAMGAAEDVDEIEDFLRGVQAKAKRSPRTVTPEQAHLDSRLEPDKKDPSDRRGGLVEQLALIARASLDPSRKSIAREVVSLVRDPEPRAISIRRLQAMANETLIEIEPFAQHLFLDTLGVLGEAGQEALAKVCRDRSCEPALRGRALDRMAWPRRGELALEMFREEKASEELRVHAFRSMATDGHEALEATAKELLTELAATRPGAASAAERFLYLSALRALEARGRLRTEDLVPLVPHARTVRLAAGRRAEELAGRVEDLTELAARKAGQDVLRRTVAELLDFVEEADLNPRVTAMSRKSFREYVEGKLKDLPRRADDLAYRRLVVDAIVTHLLGGNVRQRTRGPGDFDPYVALEPEILLALGRTGTPAAAEALVDFLENRRSALRAEACLALGATGQRSGAATLAGFLLDEDPFVRFCADEALDHLVGADEPLDWMYGSSQVRTAAAEARWRAVQRDD